MLVPWKSPFRLPPATTCEISSARRPYRFCFAVLILLIAANISGTASLTAETASGKSDIKQRAATSHWAFLPLKKIAPPKVKNKAWAKSPIDKFILAKLEARGLLPAPPADKRTLIRRATFDLIGLPPTPEEVDAFLADSSPDAFARVVDRLLDSPHYGERWGRHWLDVARCADIKGYVFYEEKT